MYYELTTYRDLKIKLSTDFKFIDFMKTLNNREIDAIAIGSVSMLKNNIRDIRPVYEEGETPVGEKLVVYTNRSEEPFFAYAENYDSAEVANQVNTRLQNFIIIGDTGIHRNEYSLVMAAQ